MRVVRQSTPSDRGALASGPSKASRAQAKPIKPQPESKLIFVLGGARSGKSSFALQQGKVQSPRAFLATAEGFDSEMAVRIQKHKRSRGQGWTTFEVPTQLTEWFAGEGANYPSVVVDCLTLWLNNLLREKVRPRQVPSHIRKLLKAIKDCPSQVVMVSNELGLGLVPGDDVSREFRDVAGRMNQLIAADADEVHFLVSGLPLRLK